MESQCGTFWLAPTNPRGGHCGPHSGVLPLCLGLPTPPIHDAQFGASSHHSRRPLARRARDRKASMGRRHRASVGRSSVRCAGILPPRGQERPLQTQIGSQKQALCPGSWSGNRTLGTLKAGCCFTESEEVRKNKRGPSKSKSALHCAVQMTRGAGGSTGGAAAEPRLSGALHEVWSAARVLTVLTGKQMQDTHMSRRTITNICEK